MLIPSEPLESSYHPFKLPTRCGQLTPCDLDGGLCRLGGVREMVVRAVGELEDPRAIPVLNATADGSDDAVRATTALTDRENWNTDLLFRYRLNPWTALFVGYNNNRRNVELEEESGTTSIVRTDGLKTDGQQLVVKLSYLIRR